MSRPEIRFLFLILGCCMSGQAITVNPNLGTIVRQRGRINAAVIKLSVVIKLDQLPGVTETDYPSPCEYLALARESVAGDFNINHHSMFLEYQHMCEHYETVRDHYLNLRELLQHQQERAIAAMRLFRQPRRKKRSLPTFLRNVFGIAHRKKQQQLQHTINRMGKEMFEIEGNIKGLDFMIKLNDQRISTLSTVTKEYVEVMKSVTNTLSAVRSNIQDNEVIRRHILIWMSDTLVEGALYNQMLIVHNEMLHTRVRAISEMARGKLTPELIDPIQLNSTLTHLQNTLDRKYQDLHLTTRSLWDYYTIENIVSYYKNGSFYVSIPVKLEMTDQTYELYEVESFMVPVEGNQSQTTILMDYVDLLAVNIETNSYCSMSHHFLNEHCHGKTVRTCNKMFMNKDLTRAPSCASMIFMNNLEAIHQLCKIELVEVKPAMNPLLIDLQNSSVLIVNPARKTLYSRCNDFERKKNITNDPLVTININSFCYLFNDAVSTPVYVGSHCLDQPVIELVTYPHVNISYLLSNYQIT